MDLSPIVAEFTFKAVRSSGPGGQHVNKTSSKVTVSFNILRSEILTEEQKLRLQKKLTSQLTNDGVLQLSSQETRSQHRNKALAIQKMLALIEDTLRLPKRRKKSKPHKAAIEKRIKAKKNQALKKANRKKPKDY